MFHRVVGLFGLAFACVSWAPVLALEPRLGDVPPAEARAWPYSGELPGCDHSFVLAQIQRGFWDRERDYWNSALSLDAFDVVREIGFRTNGLSYIPRRYCEAQAQFNDGVRRKVVYQIGEGLGFIGLGWGVQWCVDGLDRNLAYAPHCKAAGP
jgi:hypothetical protein